jgi:hypothetical protein
MATTANRFIYSHMDLYFDDPSYFVAATNPENILKTEMIEFNMKLELGSSNFVDYNLPEV